MNSFMLYLFAMFTSGTLQVTSPSFKENELMPAKYTCEGINVSPPLDIKNIPAQTKSIAIIMDDPDAAGGTYDHWIVWNLEPAQAIAENIEAGILGRNGSGNTSYKGPCPPTGTHHYHFKVYALDMMLTLKEGSSKAELQTAMQEHIIANGDLVGLYQKMNQ